METNQGAHTGAALVEGAETGGSAMLRRADERLRGLRTLFGSADQHTSPELFLIGLVRAVRTDDREAPRRSRREVLIRARRRRRRLGVLSLGAGPFAAVASQLVDLYAETAIVCDLASAHALPLRDEELAAHMLTLWAIAPNAEQARAALTGTAEMSVASMLRASLGPKLHRPDPATARGAARAVWEARAALAGAREGSRSGALRGVLFAGRRTKRAIKRAELQLGIA